MPNNKEDIINRLKEARIALALKSGEFARKAGIDPRNYSSIENGNRSIGERSIQDICSAHKINRDWLITGQGEMIRADNNYSDGEGIPYYDMDATASITESFHDVREEVQYYINYPPLNDCDAAFPVYGDSMVPDFYPGEVILVREIRNVDSMLWGEPYLVITNADCDNLRTIKNVYLSEDRQKFILRATNPRYAGDTIVPRDSVLKIFLVKGKLNRRQL